MNKTYILKKDLKIPDDLKEKDNKKRKKVEEIMGKKLTDYEWVKYKQMMNSTVK